jgi:PDZ domain-containing protein
MIMPTARVIQLTPLTAIGAWLDPQTWVAPEPVVYPPGLDPEEEERLSFSQMDQSKIAATAVVLERLTRYPRDHGPGALIESTSTDCPADGHLFPGDIVTAIDGEEIDSRAEASRIIGATPEGTEMDFTLDVDGTEVHASFARSRCIRGQDDAFVGVVMVDTFPFPVQMASGEVGGPSAGLMWAVGLYELLTPGDLSAGRVIAGTGTVGLDGSVGGIGGVLDKVHGAQQAGADLFLLPRSNLPDLEGVDTGPMEVIAVDTFDGAVEALESVAS